MIEIRRTPAFAAWLRKLRDETAVAKIAFRLDRLRHGNPGDVRPVSDGISEMRIHHGPGYQVYFVQRGQRIVVLLCGGDKSSQERDIRASRVLAKEV